MSMGHEFYARFAAEERMAELRSEAQMWRLAQAAAGRRCTPEYRLRLSMARVTAASRQVMRSSPMRSSAMRSSAPGARTPGSPVPGAVTPQPCDG